MKRGVLLISVVFLLLSSCVVDQRKAQWHCNAIMVQQQEIVEVWNRWDLCYADTFTFRYLHEKKDSVVMLLDRLDKTLDTLSLPNEDDQLVLATRNWSKTLRNDLLPKYQKKNESWTMMSLWWNDQNSKDWKLLDEEIEISKANSNAQMEEAVATFIDEYNLSFNTP